MLQALSITLRRPQRKEWAGRVIENTNEATPLFQRNDGALAWQFFLFRALAPSLSLVSISSTGFERPRNDEGPRNEATHASWRNGTKWRPKWGHRRPKSAKMGAEMGPPILHGGRNGATHTSRVAGRNGAPILRKQRHLPYRRNCKTGFWVSLFWFLFWLNYNMNNCGCPPYHEPRKQCLQSGTTGSIGSDCDRSQCWATGPGQDTGQNPAGHAV